MFSFFKKSPKLIEISPSIIIFTAAFIGGAYFLFMVRNILMLLFMGFITMVALHPAVDKIEKLIKSRIAAIITTYILVLVAIAGAMAFILPPLVNELIQLLKQINIPYLQDEISQLKFTATEVNDLANNFGGSVNALVSFITSTFRGLFTFLTLIVISFYLMIDEPHLHKKIGWLTGQKAHHKIARKFLDDLKHQLGGWLRGELILMLVIGGLTYAGLMILGVPYALPLALLAGLLEILPNLGPTLASVPAIIIAYLNQSYTFGLMVAGLYIIIQQLENNLVVPKVMQTSANVNPLASILSILIGFEIGGVIGGLMAVPIYIMLRTTYSYWRKYEDKLKSE